MNNLEIIENNANGRYHKFTLALPPEGEGGGGNPVLLHGMAEHNYHIAKIMELKAPKIEPVASKWWHKIPGFKPKEEKPDFSKWTFINDGIYAKGSVIVSAAVLGNRYIEDGKLNRYKSTVIGAFKELEKRHGYEFNSIAMEVSGAFESVN